MRMTKVARQEANTNTYRAPAGQATPVTDASLHLLWAGAFHRRKTPLHWAAIQGHEAVAAALLDQGADVNAKDSGGCGGWSLFWATVGVWYAAWSGGN